MSVIKVPRYYDPRPYQREAWGRRLSGQYDYYLKIWHRQCIAGDTEVLTEAGWVKASELSEGIKVFTYCKEKEEMEFAFI